MKNTFKFTHSYIKEQYRAALNKGYSVITCENYCHLKKAGTLPAKTLVNRVDIDFSVKKAEVLADIFDELKIKATFFLRLHAPEYNPLSFENYRIIKKIIAAGHEIGYHSEVVDQAAIWGESAEDCLVRDIATINNFFGVTITGVASHGGSTGLNNLDFWKDRKPTEFGLLYEGYDKEKEFNLFQESFYISDSEWTRWKCYDKGVLRAGDQRSLSEHLEDSPSLVYFLIHPDTYFKNHFYE